MHAGKIQGKSFFWDGIAYMVPGLDRDFDNLIINRAVERHCGIECTVGGGYVEVGDQIGLFITVMSPTQRDASILLAYLSSQFERHYERANKNASVQECLRHFTIESVLARLQLSYI